MELFEKLFGELLLFVYHCFDRIVIALAATGIVRAAWPPTTPTGVARPVPGGD